MGVFLVCLLVLLWRTCLAQRVKSVFNQSAKTFKRAYTVHWSQKRLAPLLHKHYLNEVTLNGDKVVLDSWTEIRSTKEV